MNDLIARIRATMDTEAAAIDAYHQHREHGPHINYPGQNPDDYSGYDSCSTCIATAQAIRFHRPDTGRRIIDAHGKILELHKFDTYDIGGSMFRYCLACGSGEPLRVPRQLAMPNRARTRRGVQDRHARR